MSTKSSVNVIVVDDQALVRGAIAALVDLEPDICVLDQAGDGHEAINLLRHYRDEGISVDVVLLDIEMPVMDGITTCETLRARFPQTQVLMLTTFGRPGYLKRALDAGAIGFIVKDAPSEQLATAIRKVAAGQRVIDPTLAMEALAQGHNPLTEREIDVLRIVSRGGTIADIAHAAGLSQGTTRNHISNTMMKTGARTRAEAVRIATEAGWL